MSGKSGASPRVIRYGFTCPDRAVFFVRWKKANMSIRGIAECRRRDNRGRERAARVCVGVFLPYFVTYWTQPFLWLKTIPPSGASSASALLNSFPLVSVAIVSGLWVSFKV